MCSPDRFTHQMPTFMHTKATCAGWSIRYFGLLRGFRRRQFQCPVCYRTLSTDVRWRLPEEPIRRRHRSASNRRSRCLSSALHLHQAGFPIPAGARGRPTSPHARLSSIDTPNQQCCTHRSRSDWRSRRPHLYHRSLFTDFLHCGAEFAAWCHKALTCADGRTWWMLAHCSSLRELILRGHIQSGTPQNCIVLKSCGRAPWRLRQSTGLHFCQSQ